MLLGSQVLCTVICRDTPRLAPRPALDHAKLHPHLPQFKAVHLHTAPQLDIVRHACCHGAHEAGGSTAAPEAPGSRVRRALQAAAAEQCMPGKAMALDENDVLLLARAKVWSKDRLQNTSHKVLVKDVGLPPRAASVVKELFPDPPSPGEGVDALEAGLKHPNLGSIAGTIELDGPDMYYVQCPGKERKLVHDPNHAALRLMEIWVGDRKANKGGGGPLLVDGLPEVGKTLMMTMVLPSVVAKHFNGQPVAVLSIDLAGAPVDKGWEAVKRHFLERVLIAARTVGLRAPNVTTAELVLKDGRAIERSTIASIFWSLPTTALILIDELHLLLSAKRQEGAALVHDTAAAMEGAQLVKDIALLSGNNCLAALSAKAMALVWACLHETPPHGAHILHCTRQLSLPAVHSDREAVRRVLEEHVDNISSTPGFKAAMHVPDEHGSTPLDKLMSWGETAAVMCCAASDAHDTFLTTGQLNIERAMEDARVKVVRELTGDWSLAMADWSRERRLVVRALADCQTGAELKRFDHSSLARHLLPLTEPVDNTGRRRRLRTPVHRLSMMCLISPSGELMKQEDCWVGQHQGC